MFEEIVRIVLTPISLLISFIYKMLLALVNWFMFHFMNSELIITNEEMNMLYALCILFGAIGTFILFKSGAYLRFTNLKRKIRRQRRETFYGALEYKKRKFDAFGKKYGFKTPSLDELERQELETNPTAKQRFEDDNWKY